MAEGGPNFGYEDPNLHRNLDYDGDDDYDDDD